MRLSIPYKLNDDLFGAWIITVTPHLQFVCDLGAQGTVLAGGRYDGLVSEMGGPVTPGIGWAAGVSVSACL